MATLAQPAPPPVTGRPKLVRRVSKSHTPFRLHTAPVLFASLCFVAGILLARQFQFMAGLLGIALLVSFAVAAIANICARYFAWVAIALLFVLLGIFCSTVYPGLGSQTELAILADGKPRLIEGVVIRLGPVRIVASSSPFSNKIREEHSQQIDLRLMEIAGVETSSTSPPAVRVMLYSPLDAPFPFLSCGQRLRGNLAMHLEERFLDPGVWDASEYLREQGIGALASARASDLTVLAAARRFNFNCELHSLQQRAVVKINRFADDFSRSRLPEFFRLSSEDAAMLAAMVTGDRTFLRRRLRAGFERTGSFHLLVVSGLHLAIFSAIVFALARQLRLKQAWATVITIASSCCYAVFTGFGHPMQRALGMVTIYLIGRLLWRDRSAFNAIGLVAIVLLAADPKSLFDSGMQMTLLSVVAIAGVASPIAERSFAPYLHAMRNLGEIRVDPTLSPRIAQFRVSLRMLAQHLRPLTGSFVAWRVLPFALKTALRIVELFVVSTTIELFMMLPMAAYFHRITVLALPVNLMIVPFLGLLLPCALLTLIAITLLPSIAFVPASATAILLHLVSHIVSLFGGIRAADWRVPMPPVPAIVIWIALCIAAICLVRLRRFSIASALLALATGALIITFPRPIHYRPHQLEITAIDVGQGDSLLVVTPEGKTLLIDAGGLVGASPDSNFEVGEDVVSPVLWSRGIRRLDAMAITHAHADHIGGMPAVLENFRPRELWIGKNPHVPPYDRVLAIAKDEGTQVKIHAAGDAFTFGSIQIEVLAPAPDYRPGTTPTNNDSLVLRMEYGKTSALLEGDAEAPSEARMVREGGLSSNLLKLGHHGSISSTTPAFLAAVSPSYAVISVGRRNFYGHPRREVLHELQSSHVKTFLTEMTGLTSFYLDGVNVSAEAWAADPH